MITITVRMDEGGDPSVTLTSRTKFHSIEQDAEVGTAMAVDNPKITAAQQAALAKALDAIVDANKEAAALAAHVAMATSMAADVRSFRRAQSEAAEPAEED